MEIVKDWSEIAQIERITVKAVLDAIKIKGRYIPPKTHTLYSWWQSVLLEQ
ncbi:hypothetical protein [Spirulina subsalsa]|uniref:hypothetical protein n=1 Tax=Spirulina subsalsa TaxID=54311 RepID=UPI0002DE9EF3|nr:hypothetical protein [Spirulina subsalsa]